MLCIYTTHFGRKGDLETFFCIKNCSTICSHPNTSKLPAGYCYLWCLSAVLGVHNLLNNPKFDEETTNGEGRKGPVRSKLTRALGAWEVPEPAWCMFHQAQCLVSASPSVVTQGTQSYRTHIRGTSSSGEKKSIPDKFAQSAQNANKVFCSKGYFINEGSLAPFSFVPQCLFCLDYGRWSLDSAYLVPPESMAWTGCSLLQWGFIKHSLNTSWMSGMFWVYVERSFPKELIQSNQLVFVCTVRSQWTQILASG
jgi:hypothetical protein